MTTTFHAHWHDLPAACWRWINFLPAEIACHGTGSLRINEEALDSCKPFATDWASP